MRIREVSDITGVTGKNIRYYENEGLFRTGRKAGKGYWHFSDEDVKELKKIKLLRKLGVALSDIVSIQRGGWSLGEFLGMYIDSISQHAQMGTIAEICSEIMKNESKLKTLDADKYLNKIEIAEKNGAVFPDSEGDYKSRGDECLQPSQAKIFFEPDEPIMNRMDFAKELEKHAERKGLPLTITHLSMRPEVLLDGKAYICALEMPRMLHFPGSPFFVAVYNFGYRWVYLYEDVSKHPRYS